MINLSLTPSRPLTSPLVFAIYPNNTGLTSQVWLYSRPVGSFPKGIYWFTCCNPELSENSPLCELPLLHLGVLMLMLYVVFSMFLWVKLCMFILCFYWKHTYICMRMSSTWGFSLECSSRSWEIKCWNDRWWSFFKLFVRCCLAFKIHHHHHILLLILLILILITIYPAGESSRRRLFLQCVVSLVQSNVIFCHAERLVPCQRE